MTPDPIAVGAAAPAVWLTTAKRAQRARPEPIEWREWRARFLAESGGTVPPVPGELYLGAEWMRAGDEEPRRWLAFDFDDERDPARALAEARDFTRWRLLDRGVPRRSLVPCCSGRKGWKLFFRPLTPPWDGWPSAFRLAIRDRWSAYQTLDAQMPTVPHIRAPWSRHPRIRAWQRVLTWDAFWSESAAKLMADARIEPRIRGTDILASLPDPRLEWPPEAAVWLDEIRMEAEADALVSRIGRKRRRPSEFIGGSWESILRGLSWEFREVTGRPGWLRLRECPFCGRRWKAAVNPAGWLACYRTSCEAADGIGPRQWTRRFHAPLPRGAGRRPSGLLIRQRPDIHPLPLDEARRELSRVMERAFDEASVRELIVIRATPGAGKTEAALRLAVGGDRRIAIGTDTRDLRDQLAGRAMDIARARRADDAGGWLHVLLARNEETCRRMIHARAAGARGYPPGIYVCPRCSWRGRCAYYAGLLAAGSARVVIGTYESILSAMAQDAMSPDILLLDEDPRRALAGVVGAARALLDETADAAGTPANAAGILRALSDAAGRLARAAQRRAQSREKRGAGEWRGMTVRGAEMLEYVARAGRWADAGEMARDMLTAAADMRALRPSKGALAMMSIAQIDALPDMRAVDLIERLAHEAISAQAHPDAPSPVSLRADGSGRAEYRAAVVRRPKTVTPMIVLDAYADEEIYRRLTGLPTRALRVDAEIPAEMTAVPLRASRAAFANPAAKSRILRAVARQAESMARAGIRRILALCYMSVEADVEEAMARAREIGARTDVRHWGAGRGVDVYRTAGGVIAVGAPEPPPDDVIEWAGLLYAGDGEPLSLDPHPTMPRAYADARMRTAHESMREAELAQGVHRARLALAPENGGPRKRCAVIGMVDCPLLPAPRIVVSRENVGRPGGGPRSAVVAVSEAIETLGYFSFAMFSAMREMVLTRGVKQTIVTIGEKERILVRGCKSLKSPENPKLTFKYLIDANFGFWSKINDLDRRTKLYPAKSISYATRKLNAPFRDVLVQIPGRNLVRYRVYGGAGLDIGCRVISAVADRIVAGEFAAANDDGERAAMMMDAFIEEHYRAMDEAEAAIESMPRENL